MLLLVVSLLLGSYLLGATPIGYLLARWIGGIDIRQHGSGNIGATNVGRVLGWRYFPLVFALDFAKGAVPVLVARGLTRESANCPLDSEAATTLAGLAAIVGHMWPVYLGFRGGKGVATSAGVVIFLTPLPALVAVLTWLVVFLVTRYVSLSSVAATGALSLAQLAVWWWQPFGIATSRAVTLFCLLGAALVVFRHRSNLTRLWHGTEPKIGQQPASPGSVSAGSPGHRAWEKDSSVR